MYGQRLASLRTAAAQSGRYDLRRWVQVSDVPVGEMPVEMSPGKQFLQVTTQDLMDYMAFITSRLNTFLSSRVFGHRDTFPDHHKSLLNEFINGNPYILRHYHCGPIGTEAEARKSL